MDIMMIGYYLNPAAVAVYNVATRITNYMEVPMSGLSQAVYPRIAMANNTGSRTAVADLYEKSIGLLLAILLPMGLGVWLLADWVVLLVAGKAYLAAAPLLQILVLAVMMKPWGRLFGITLDAIGRPRLNFALLALSLVANVVLNALLIPRWGLHGAAAATSASIGLLVVSGQVLMASILPVQQRRIWQYAFKTYTQPRQLLGQGEKTKT
jgi:O-antigen/teichoic acid export membrane protein